MAAGSDANATPRAVSAAAMRPIAAALTAPLAPKYEAQPGLPLGLL